jgi:hypothetical protein
MSEFTKVEVKSKNPPKKVSIKPYFDPSVENMGLENYGLALYDGVYHEEQLACLEKNGIKRYVTGLNEFAPDVKLIRNPEQKEAKIKQIRLVVAELERDLAANVIDVDDAKFWDKVSLLKPNNDEFWGKISLRAGNDTTYLDPEKNPYDLIKLFAIEAGGFTLIAKSLEDAQSKSTPPKFYLDKYEETVSTKNEVKKIRNKALAKLQEMYDKTSKKLLYVTKVIVPGSPEYIYTTPNDVLYEIMDDYINGLSFEKDKKRTAEDFLSTAKMSMEDLKLKSLIKDATFYKYISPKSDGFIYHVKTSTMLGRNSNDVLEYLKNPLNDEILKLILDPIEKLWAK